MSSVKYIALYFTFWNILDQTSALQELPLVEDNDILRTEVVIRDTTNKIFSAFKLKGIKNKPKLRQYALIHNYFVSLTLQDYNNLKEISGLTRTNKNIDNKTVNFMVLLNQVLNEDNSVDLDERSTVKHDKFTEELVSYIDDHIKELGHMRFFYGKESPRVGINKQILKILSEKDGQYLNESTNNIDKADDNNVLYKNEFWHGDEESGRRVYKGRTSKIKYFPFMAVVQIFQKFQCGGSIIHSDLVLTAASCLQLAWNNRLYRENPAFLSVRIGTKFYDGGGEVIPVLEVYFQPSYDPKTLKNNLAVMRLHRLIKFKSKHVKRISIDKYAHPLPMNTDGITLVGWGARTVGNVIKSPWENQLAYAILDVYPLDDCQEVYSKQYVTKKNFCAGYISKGTGACNRDVGGPGVAHGVLVGVVSFGAPVCGTPDHPTVFTKVGYYADWIEQIMEQDVPRASKLTTIRPLTIREYIPNIIKEPQNAWTLVPITESRQINTFNYETDHRPTTKRIKPPADGSLFKQFLKTMFDSNEIDDYIDGLKQRNPFGRNRGITKKIQGTKMDNILQELVIQNIVRGKESESTTESYKKVTVIDENLILDPHKKKKRTKLNREVEESEQENAQETEESEQEKEFEAEVIAKPQVHSKYHGKEGEINPEPEIKESLESDGTGDTLDLNIDAEKELEKDIMQLIDGTDFKEIVKGSIADTETLKNGENNNDEDFENKLDDSILTLLYLSDNDKDNDKRNNKDNDNDENGFKIFDKDDDGEDFNDKLSEGEGKDTDVPDDDKIDINMIEKMLLEESGNKEEESKDSGENNEDEDDGLAIASDTFKDFTYRNDNKSDVFSKKFIYDILSEVIDFETKKIKVKR